jgi:hypothetical protein
VFTEHGHCPYCDAGQDIVGSDLLVLYHECVACHRSIEVKPNPAYKKYLIGVDHGEPGGDRTIVHVHRAKRRTNPFKLIQGGKS